MYCVVPHDLIVMGAVEISYDDDCDKYCIKPSTGVPGGGGE